MKTAGIVVIGDEVLKGQVTDQNLAFLAPKLHSLGIKLRKVSIIPDSIEEIAKEVSEFSSKYDTVITTGGIGPTHDDLTYEGVAAAFGDELILSDEIVKFWSYYTGDPKALKTSTRKFATVPKSSLILYPEISTSLISKGRFPVVTVKNVVIFPGVPKYLEALFRGLQGTYFNSFGIVFHNKAIYLRASEPDITDILNETVNKFGPVVQFGSYPKINNDYYRVIITFESEDKVELEKAYQYFISKINPSWIAMDGDLLGNAYKNTMDLLKCEKLGNFIKTLTNSIQVVEKCLDDYKINEIFISFNGGKDCTALLHLVHSILVKKYGEQEYPTLTGVYFKHDNSFKEVEEFITQAAQRYKLNLIICEGRIKEGLSQLVKKEGQNWKACFMGVRRQDPNCMNLKPFQSTDSGWPDLVRVSPILDWTYQDIWTYLIELKIPYCSLYDQGKWILSEAPLSDIKKAAEELSSILHCSVGPSGLSVLVNDGGKNYVTKTGIEVLKIYEQCRSPARNFLINCVKNLYHNVGDGVKTFLIMLSSILTQANKFYPEALFQLNELAVALYKVSKNFVNETQDHCLLSNTFFNTRFPMHISMKLSSLFNEWIYKNRESIIINENVYDYLIKYFDSLVILKGKSSPISESKVVKGVLAVGNYYGQFPIAGIKHLLVGFLLSEDNLDNQEEMNINIKRLESELGHYKCSNILVITNGHLPPKSLQLLSKYKLLTHVQSDLMYLINEYCMNYKTYNCTYPSIEFDLLNSFRKGIFINIPIYSIFLYSPSECYSLSYLDALRSILKLCKFARNNKSPLIECNEFEKLFSLHFAASFSDNMLIPSITCNTCILEEWFTQINKIKKNNHGSCTYALRETNNLEKTVEEIIMRFKEFGLCFCEEVVDLVCQMLLNFSMKPVINGQKGVEPLHLKLLIISTVLTTFCRIMNIDKVIKINKTSKFEVNYA